MTLPKKQTFPALKIRRRFSWGAFTLIELLAILAVIVILATLLLPARARSDSHVQALQCLYNQQQLMMGLLMYTQENSDLFPPNPDDRAAIPGHFWCDYQTEQYTGYDPNFLRTNCVLMPYVNDSVELFRCTLETRSRVVGNPPVRQPALRSLSMNQAVGTICMAFDRGSGHSGKPILSVNGPWLDNTHSNRRNAPYRTYGRTSEIGSPSPASLWVLLEEDPLSINDASFAFGMSTSEWIDFPTSAHEFGCVFGFADGHSELHKWKDARTRAPWPVVRRPAPNSVDWLWMAARTSSRAP